MDKIFPEKLKDGDEVRIIAPSRSLAIISPESREIANKRFEELGLKLSFGKHIEEIDDFASSSIESRVEDLHDAFSDRNVKAIITVVGGFNCNQLFRYHRFEQCDFYQDRSRFLLRTSLFHFRTKIVF